MRLAAAFFANRADVVDDMPNVEGGPTGQRWAPAWSTKFQLPSAMKFMVPTQIALPIEPNGGRHVYSFRLEGSHERLEIPLDVVIQ